MVDGIQINDFKGVFPDDADTKTIVSTKTGVLSEKETALYRGLHIASYTNGRMRLSGSLTTFINGDNTINLSFDQVSNSIDELCKLFKTKPDDNVLNGLEIGLNIKVNFDPDRFLNNLLSWNRIEPLRWTGKKECYVQFRNSQLTFKVYSKSKQYSLTDNLLRLEIRFDKMQFAHKYNVRTLADLKDRNKIESLLNVLIDSFDDLIYYDDTII
ncbi:hypothetical protein [Plebeiibacterium sediminum]|uniref:Uncharacterized protein n=1 Tax=Plebeiibacterium sediminum TaxID=2992112 RepID=A0AAE3M9D0_9BACT|nr:hypothetical protein [Plebeiobacterium sediminum]MCW3789473.1 hypothetical protein [Plebeiobacterium sediminum]